MPRGALERILKRCSADASCAKAFTDPSADYRALRARLAARPEPTMVSDAATGRPIRFEFTTRHLSAVLRFASYNDDQAALLPLSLHMATHEENFTPLASQFRVFAHSLEAAFAYGMHNSVACSEDTPLIDAGKLDLPALDATHMGVGAGAAAHRRLPAMAAWRGRCGSARAAEKRRRRRCCSRAPTIR